MNQDCLQLPDSSLRCPLCDEQISPQVPAYRVPARWREAFQHREIWGEVAEQFRAHQSIEATAAGLSITTALAEYLLQFLCREICGCRTVTCVSCLDDYRNLL